MEPPPKDLLATLKDQRGRTVYLTKERWNNHIIVPGGHPELAPYLEDVKDAVRLADVRTEGNHPDTEMLWARNLAGSKWVMVVVRYAGRKGTVLTAHRFKKGPDKRKRL